MIDELMNNMGECEHAASDDTGDDEIEQQGGKAGRRAPKRAFMDDLDAAILKAMPALIAKLPRMLETNASNVLAIRKAADAATKSLQARKERRNAAKRDERRRRMVEEGPQSLSNVKLEAD